MNAAQAKEKVKLVDVMERLGYEVQAIERGRTEHKYSSPFRAEVQASFNLNLNKNQWFDFGLNEGGGVIEFGTQYLKSEGLPHTISDVLNWYRDDMGYGSQKTLFSLASKSGPQAQIFENVAPKHLEFVRVAPLTSKVILAYLESRRIPPVLAKAYLQLIQYRNAKQPSKKLFFGFGMKNLSGGYEVRSANDTPGGRFQSALIARDITFWPGFDEGRREVAVFEGMLDYLSLMVMLGVSRLKGDAVILNSVTSFNKAVTFIEGRGYQKINTFLDNDESGQKHADRFDNSFGDAHRSWSDSFAPHKDLNKALVAGHSPVFAPVPGPQSDIRP